MADIDLALEQYGPEGARRTRGSARVARGDSRLRFFGDAEHGPKPFTFEEMKATFAGLDGYFDTLEPSDRPAAAPARQGVGSRAKYHDTQMRMARQLASPFPPHVLTVVIGWATVLFLGNGLAATPNAVTVIALLAGAISIATAIFLILELSNPYIGFISVSSAGVDNALQVLGDVDAAARDETAPASPIARTLGEAPRPHARVGGEQPSWRRAE